jgi:hypothetical protein
LDRFRPRSLICGITYAFWRSLGFVMLQKCHPSVAIIPLGIAYVFFWLALRPPSDPVFRRLSAT